MIQQASRWLRRIAWFVGLGLTFALLLGPSALPQVANAATSCTGQTFLFDGTNPTSTNSYGTKASMNTQTPALCGASWSHSSIWVMTTGSGASQYAQTGYIRLKGQSTVNYFSEYDKNSSTAFVRKITTAASGTHSYYTQYNFSTGHISMVRDTTTMDTTNFDPAVSWSAPWTPQWEGEVHDGGDDIAGSSASPVNFSGIQIITCRSCGWSTPSGLVISSDSGRYGFAWNSNTQFHIWTK